MSYSPLETLLKKDFGQVDEEEMRRLEPLLKSLVRRLATRLSRRRMASRQGRVPNLRRSLRRNLGSGGELFQLLYKQRRREKADLVLVLDVSGSMELYGRFLFHLAYLFSTSGRRGRGGDLRLQHRALPPQRRSSAPGSSPGAEGTPVVHCQDVEALESASVSSPCSTVTGSAWVRRPRS